jgi:hypothetical protein
MRLKLMSFNRVPLNVIAVTVVASYAAQFLAIIQNLPLWVIALATVLPWVPVFTLEMMWRYRHYSWLALFEVVLISQLGHFVEHLVQMYQIHVLGLAGPAARGIFGQLDIEWVHFGFNTYLLVAFAALALRFRRNPWLWVSVAVAVIHEFEHLYIMANFFRTGTPGLPGLVGRGGVINLALTRADVHFLYNLVESVPMMLAFVWQLRVAYDEWLAKAFPRLSQRDLASATQHLQAIRANIGDVIVREGEPADRFYIITSGRVDVLRGKRAVARLGPGEYFGEIGLLGGEPRVATVRAVEPTELLALDRGAFASVIASSAETVEDLQRIVAQRVASLTGSAAE